jgi:beta-glucanase (GH16 family)
MTGSTVARRALFAAPLLAAAACSSSGDGASGPPADAGVTVAADAGSDAASPPPPPRADGAIAPDSGGSPADAAPEASGLAGWTLVWSDEFDAKDGTPIDASKWNQETGNGGWQTNQEREYYTPGTANAVQQGGSLVITATDQGASQYSPCGYGTCKYTSARFNTSGKFEQAYGRFESRIQIPKGQGLWPAWWMLGNDIGTAGWPQCGEIDVMENVGKTPSTNYGSMHGPGYSGAHPLTAQYTLANGAVLGDAYHLFAAEWEPDVVRFYVDGVLYETRTPADVPAGDKWVYDHPFFIILNVAVGGGFPGDPDGTTSFPQTMKVDYVRVYVRAGDGG